MRNEASGAVDVFALGQQLGGILERAGFDADRPTMSAALNGYEEWLRKPVRGLTWGDADRAVVFMDTMADGTFEIHLRRYVDAEGCESIVGVNLTFDMNRTPGLRGVSCAAYEAVDDPPAIWVECVLRRAPAIAAALAADNPVAAMIQSVDVEVT